MTASTLKDFLPELESNQKLVILGNYSGDNVGDSAILQIMINDLRDCDVSISVVSRKPDLLAKAIQIPKHTSIVQFRTSPLALFKADIVIVGGGTIYSKYAGPFVYTLNPVLILLSLLGKKIFFYSIGYEISTPHLIGSAMRLTLKRAIKISVRDTNSSKILKKMTSKRIDVIEDPVNRLKQISTHENKKKNVLCFFNPLKESDFTDSLLSNYTKLIRKLASVDHERIFVLCSFYKSTDESFNNKICNQVNMKNVIVHSFNPNPLYWQQKMAESEYVLAQRLHSMIIASTTNTKFYAFSYQDKCREFLKHLSVKVHSSNVEKGEFEIVSISEIILSDLRVED